jgi:mannitol/fructose-specific phosphotransferase system IIA component (Ntr-type)
MALPVSLVYEVRAGDKILTCPNCARILFCPPRSTPRRIAQRQRRFAPAKVGVARFSAPTLMLPHVKATSRDDLIALLAQRLEENEFVDSAELLNEEALRREAIMSTAVEHGLAFPHVRGVEGGGLTLALATSKKGIRFNSEARGLTRIVFFVVIPTAASAFYLKLLAGLTESCQKKENREKILKAETEDKLWKALLTTTRTTVR